MKSEFTRLLSCVAVAVVGLSVLSSNASAAPAAARPAVAPAASSTTSTAAPAIRSHPQHKTARVCGTAHAHAATCFAIRQTDTVEPAVLTAHAVAPAAVPSGYGPANLRSAYNLTATGSSTSVVAIVDAYDDPSAEADLGTYRTQYGLPACTTANGCFRKVNGNGAPSPLPAANTGWAGEISLDLDMVSAICPNCHILLVEAGSASNSALYTAEDTAAASGAKYVSNSWGGAESSSQTSDDAHFKHPGVAITASSGDNGAGASYPATSQYVTAVGGTSLSAASNARGWAETAWSGAGSGCSAYDPKPSFQASVATSCARRAEADVSAVADPNTGVAVYQTYGGTGWQVYGGTSAAAPVIASVYALAGTPSSSTYPNSYPYAHTSSLNDVTSGTNGTCGAPLCAATAGWDGPTGLGTPNGTAALAASGATGGVTVNNPGAKTGKVGTAFSLTLSASGGTGSYTWSATGLPSGIVISSGGVISGTPTTAGSFTVTVTATSGSSSGTASFALTISAAGGCSSTQLLGNPGFETGTAAPWITSNGVVSANGQGETAHAGTYFAWLDGYGTAHTDTVSQTVTIPAGCTNSTLTFWTKIDTAETTTTAAYDKLTVKIGSTTLATYSNLNHGAYTQRSFAVGSFAGQSVTVSFTGTEDSSQQTSFIIDDAALTTG